VVATAGKDGKEAIVLFRGEQQVPGVEQR